MGQLQEGHYAGLARIIAGWPHLPAPIRAAMIALLDSATHGTVG